MTILLLIVFALQVGAVSTYAAQRKLLKTWRERYQSAAKALQINEDLSQGYDKIDAPVRREPDPRNYGHQRPSALDVIAKYGPEPWEFRIKTRGDHEVYLAVKGSKTRKLGDIVNPTLYPNARRVSMAAARQMVAEMNQTPDEYLV